MAEAFTIEGPGVYRQRDGGEALVYRREDLRDCPWRGVAHWNTDDNMGETWGDDGRVYGPDIENHRDIVGYIAPFPGARPAPEAVDWQRVRIELAGAITVETARLFTDPKARAGIRAMASDAGLSDVQHMARSSVELTDALIAELKRTGGQP